MDSILSKGTKKVFDYQIGDGTKKVFDYQIGDRTDSQPQICDMGCKQPKENLLWGTLRKNPHQWYIRRNPPM
jgi:hypothetical protein